MNSVKLPLPVGRKETDEVLEALADLIADRQDSVTQAAFVADFAPAAGVLAGTTTVTLQDANDVRSRFGDNVNRRVQVGVTGGTATGREISADGVTFGATADVSYVKGVATVYYRATGTGTIVMGLTALDGSTLTHTDTLTITLS